MHVDLQSLEQYNTDRFVVNLVYKGRRSEAVMLCLLPGQEMPTHPHENFEVVLMPQTGTAILTVSDKKEVRLVPGILYYEEAGNTFRIVNPGSEPFRVLIHLIRITEDDRPAHE